MMAEHEEHPNANAQPEKRGERSEASRSPDEASRRAFIRKTAEGAAFALFGVMGLDAVVEKVVQRLEDVPATRALARATGELLHEAGIGRMAFAADGCNCPPAATFSCRDPAHPFQCTAQTPFGCTQASDFQCNPFQFLCDVVNSQGPAFHCQGGQAGFQCQGSQNPNTFYCQGGYLCPTQAQFVPTPCGPNPWDCTPAARFAETCSQTLVQCPNAGGHFMCAGDAIYRCGHAGDPDANPPDPPAGEFYCPTDRFRCNGGTLFDFQCPCAFDCEGNFECAANHVFICGGSAQTSDFDCEPVGHFTCAAGGNQCNQPGTGGYGLGDPRPGDFACIGGDGVNNNFQCTWPFTCSTVDDFTCAGAPGGADYQCMAVLFVCEPRPGGTFNCHEGSGEFMCIPEGGVSFQCQQPERYDPEW